MSSQSSAGALAVPDTLVGRGPGELTSEQASYTSADAEKTDVDVGDMTEEEQEKREEGGNGNVDVEAGSGKEGAADAAAEDEDDEYPKGAKLAFIVLALCLSIFLMSLDFVSSLPGP